MLNAWLEYTSPLALGAALAAQVRIPGQEMGVVGAVPARMAVSKWSGINRPNEAARVPMPQPILPFTGVSEKPARQSLLALSTAVNAGLAAS